MPCEVVPLRIGFSKMAAVVMETAKMQLEDFCIMAAILDSKWPP
jgi:hypothetical protein